MSNKTYDTLKYLALIVLPATEALYATLSGVWGLPYGKEIAATIAAFATFLGVILKVSSDRYTQELTSKEAEEMEE